MTVCFYIRLSSADDDIRLKAESDSVSNQRALLTQYLASRPEFSGYEPVEFVDDGFSGTNGDRPAFERMISFVRDRGSKLILCKDLSVNAVAKGELFVKFIPSYFCQVIPSGIKQHGVDETLRTLHAERLARTYFFV